MDQFELRQIGEILLKKISLEYLTNYEADFIHLLVKQRRTKEISMLMETEPCEVVRKRKVILKKVRAIYQFHMKRDPITYLQFAVKYLEPQKFRVLLFHILELAPLKKIAKIFKCQPSTAQRWIQSSRKILEAIETGDAYIKDYHSCFDNLPYLGIEEIKRSKADDRALKAIQIGNRTIKQWLEEKID